MPRGISITVKMPKMNKILVLGSGELGEAIIKALLDHPAFATGNRTVSLLARPSTLLYPSPPSKAELLQSFKQRGVFFEAGNLEGDDETHLASIFQKYHTIIYAGGLTSAPRTQLKVAQAVIVAGVREYFPWQFGVDYDIIGREAGSGLFSEQCDIRYLLRSQSRTKWCIVSCGIFMSFLFEQFWGVVGRNDRGQVELVRALGGWDHLLTTTTAKDIGICTAELVLVDMEERNKAVYIAGDTLSYTAFADKIEKVQGQPLRRELWTTEQLQKQSRQDPSDKLKKYRVVFSEARGLAWRKEDTYNAKKGIETETVEQWFARRKTG